MTKQGSINLFTALNTMGNLTGVKLAYALSKNLKMLKAEIEDIEKSFEMTPEYSEKVEKPRIELCEKFAKKDDKEKPILDGNKYVFEDIKKFEKAFDKLKEENKELVDARDVQLKEYLDLLSSDSSVQLHKVKLDDIPSTINVAQMNAILEMIEE